MNKNIIAIIAFLVLAGLVACSKKMHPANSSEASNIAPAAAKPAKKLVLKTAVPDVISVNDAAARRSLDGRYYYDLEGHRYWRNNRDGKYYLFHKSMFDNPDFKAPGG
jgi:hypothetical protein